MLSQAIEFVNKVALHNTNKEEKRIQGNNFVHADSSESKAMCYVEKKDSHSKALEPLYKVLDHVKLGHPLVLKCFEQDYTNNELKKSNKLPKIKLSTSATYCVSTTITKLLNCCRRALG